MFLHVSKAKYLYDYVLEIEFNNGEFKNVDLQNELYGEVFEPLKDKKTEGICKFSGKYLSATKDNVCIDS